jgi:hypothetical protein
MTIQANVEYLAQRSTRPIYRASSAGRNASHDIDQPTKIVPVDVNDARQWDGDEEQREFGMHKRGFDLFRHASAVTDFLDQDQIKSVYEAEIESLLKSVTGCSRVHLFDHTVRASDPEVREQKQVREPATLVHNDYTAKSGYVCLNENLGDEAEGLSQGRFQIINLWRPLVNPVQNFPLVLCDARTVNDADIVPTERRAPNHVGEILLATHNPDHRWYFFPEMASNEVVVFKTFDSENQGRNPGSIHTSIDIPGVSPDVPPRESIETRAFVFYD